MTENQISHKIIGTVIQLHQHLGPGLLESIYQKALVYDLRECGFDVKEQVPIPFIYKEIFQDVGFRIDILVQDKVIIELKTVEKITPVHHAQTLSYLRLSGLKLGLLINFNTKLVKDGIKRIVNEL